MLAALATVVAAALYAALPDDLLVAPRLVVPAIEGVLLLALLAVNPWRMTRETTWSRWVSLLLVGMIAATNLTALGLTVAALVRGAPAADEPGTLLTAALQIWATDVLVFALAYAQLDRGGPVSRSRRRREDLPPADWRFSQDEDHDAVREVALSSSIQADWVPSFPDYLIPVPDQLQRLLPRRHHAPDHPRQGADGHPGHRRAAHHPRRHRRRRGAARRLSRCGVRRAARIDLIAVLTLVAATSRHPRVASSPARTPVAVTGPPSIRRPRPPPGVRRRGAGGPARARSGPA